MKTATRYIYIPEAGLKRAKVPRSTTTADPMNAKTNMGLHNPRTPATVTSSDLIFFSPMNALQSIINGGISRRSSEPNPTERILRVISSEILFSRDCMKGNRKLTKKRANVKTIGLLSDFGCGIFRFNDTPFYGESLVNHNLPLCSRTENRVLF
jgi:hypothetical protein